MTDTVNRPMKFGQTDDVYPFIADDRWVMQQKVDGVRGQIVIEFDEEAQTTAAWVRTTSGELLKSTTAGPTAITILERLYPHLPASMAGRVRGARSDHPAFTIVLDGEIVGTQWCLFDYLSNDVTEHTPYWERLESLEALADVLKDKGIVVLPTARTPEEKTRLLEKVHAKSLEGVMVKDLRAGHAYNKRVKDMLKHKVTKTADVVVMARDNRKGQTNDDGTALNASFGVYDDAGDLMEIGNCSMIGKPDAKVGDVIEVKYLYAGNGFRLVQPSCIRIRDDKTALECDIDQLRFTNKEVLGAI